MKSRLHGPALLAATIAFALAFCLAAGGESRELVEGPLHVRFHPDDEALARQALAELSEALTVIGRRLPPGDAPILVVLCRDYREFARYAGGLAHHNIVGLAMSRHGVIVVKTPRLAGTAYDFHGTLRHELIHVLLDRNVDPDNLPRWFGEGVCMVVSGEYRWPSVARVAYMYMRGELLEPAELELALRGAGSGRHFGNAYAQSLMVTRHLIDRVGEEGFWDMVHAMRDQPFDTVLLQRAGMDTAELFESWRRTLWKFALVTSLVSGFSLFQLAAALTIVAYLRLKRKGQRTLARWAEEDEDPVVFVWDQAESESQHPWEYGEEED